MAFRVPQATMRWIFPTAGSVLPRTSLLQTAARYFFSTTPGQSECDRDLFKDFPVMALGMREWRQKNLDYAKSEAQNGFPELSNTLKAFERSISTDNSELNLVVSAERAFIALKRKARTYCTKGEGAPSPRVVLPNETRRVAVSFIVNRVAKGELNHSQEVARTLQRIWSRLTLKQGQESFANVANDSLVVSHYIDGIQKGMDLYLGSGPFEWAASATLAETQKAILNDLEKSLSETYYP